MRAVALIVGFTVFAIALTGCGEPKNYPRKTHLHCSETQETLVRDIADWREDGDWVYAVGEDGVFAVLNYRTNFHAKYKTVEESPAEYQAGLRRLRSK